MFAYSKTETSRSTEIILNPFVTSLISFHDSLREFSDVALKDFILSRSLAQN